MSKKNKIYWLSYFVCFFFTLGVVNGQEKQTSFHFGGYIKLDLINTWYENGKVTQSNLINDVHIPSLIPVGLPQTFHTFNMHAKESRFNFTVKSKLFQKPIEGFIEMDFLLSDQGNERVTNSFNPRLRHVYVKWNGLLFGQTWSTFMIIALPDDLDFAGATEGTVLIRQPILRYTYKNWSVAIENSVTTYLDFLSTKKQVSSRVSYPDFVLRKDFEKENLKFSMTAMYRPLTLDSLYANGKQTFSGYGFSAGGKSLVGKKGNDFRFVITYGNGLGRYQAVNFVPAIAVDSNGFAHVVQAVNGFVAYNHFWVPQLLSSSFNVSVFQAFDLKNEFNEELNFWSYSVSANLKYRPNPQFLVGIEYMYATRKLLSGAFGGMHRIQASVKYSFGYTNSAAVEK